MVDVIWKVGPIHACYAYIELERPDSSVPWRFVIIKSVEVH